jgi:trans-aconitate 2-methyltransferase
MTTDTWDANDYRRHSSLQEAMADEVLARLRFAGDEQVLDVGCGDGRLTARIAAMLPRGEVLGVDASPDMIAFATRRFGPQGDDPCANLRFAVADARALALEGRFDRVVSFNALHWIPDQAPALRAIARVLRPDGSADLRLVVRGAVPSLEEAAETVRRSAAWAHRFGDFQDPYLRLDEDQYVALARREGLRVLACATHLASWTFPTDAAFFGFCRAGFGAWTQQLREADRDRFVDDVIRAYRCSHHAGEAERNLFRFYQMDITLAPESVG